MTPATKPMRLIFLAALAALAMTDAQAQQASQFISFNNSIIITTANTYQTIANATQAMRSLTIQNNNTSADNCWIAIAGVVTAGMTTSTAVTIPGKPASTAANVSILLGSGQSYSRYWPHVPTGAPIVGTCATAGDSIYVDWQ